MRPEICKLRSSPSYSFRMRTFALTLSTSLLLSACINLRLQTPEELGREVVNSVHRQQSRQQCASGSDPYSQLRCERQAQQQMQEYRKDQQKSDDE